MGDYHFHAVSQGHSIRVQCPLDFLGNFQTNKILPLRYMNNLRIELELTADPIDWLDTRAVNIEGSSADASNWELSGVCMKCRLLTMSTELESAIA